MIRCDDFVRMQGDIFRVYFFAFFAFFALFMTREPWFDSLIKQRGPILWRIPFGAWEFTELNKILFWIPLTNDMILTFRVMNYRQQQKKERTFQRSFCCVVYSFNIFPTENIEVRLINV